MVDGACAWSTEICNFRSIDTSTCMTRMGELFITSGHPELIDGFNNFLPTGYAVQQPTSTVAREVRVTTPHGPIVSALNP
jgi:paired amphipathic helix protein Sin3a